MTPTITPDPALAQVHLIGVSWQADYNLLLSIQFPGPVDAAGYRVMVEDKEYDCQVLTEQPTRLFCLGRGMNVLDQVTVRIFQQGSDQPGFEGKIYVPYFTK
jgi:lipocalin